MFFQRPTGISVLAAAVLAAIVATPASLRAQDLERFRPQVPAASPIEGHEPSAASVESDPATAESAAAAAAAPADDQVFGTLSGIVLLSHPDQVRGEDLPTTPGIIRHDESLIVPAEVMAVLEGFLDGPLSLAVIGQLERDTVLAYRTAGMPVVDVGFPEQDVTAGVLQIVVVVARAGEIRVEGDCHFNENIYRRSFRTTLGEALRIAPILDDLDYLNRNPYRDVNLAYSPGEAFGEADLTVKITERRPFTAYAGYEDSGSEFLGRDRLNFGFEWGNVGGWDHLLGYQYTTTTDFDRLHAHVASYRLPIWQWRHELRVLAGYVDAETEFQAGGETLLSQGESSQVSLNYLIPLPELFGFGQQLVGGYDFKSTNNNLEFGGLTVIDSTAEIHQLSIGQEFSKSTANGAQQFSHRLVYSPGGVSGHNSDEAFQQLRGGAEADYLYWSADYTQRVDLPAGFTLIADVEGQLSSTNLLPSESLVLGGIGSIRGFESNIIRGDQGAVLNLDLYAPPFSLLDASGLGVNDSARVFAFYDQAWATNVDRLPDEAGNVHLGSLGAGLDFRVASYLSARISYGWQVDKSGFEDDDSGRLHVSTTIRW